MVQAADAQSDRCACHRRTSLTRLASTTARRGARAAVQRKRELVKQQNEVAEARRQAQASELLGAAAKGYAQRRVAKQLEDERQQKAVMIQSRIRGHKERARPTAEANIRRARSANDPAQQGAAYLEQYHIMPLFEMLAQKLLSEKPADPKQFLVQTLEEMRAVKDPTSPKNFFSDTDIETLYCM